MLKKDEVVACVLIGLAWGCIALISEIPMTWLMLASLCCGGVGAYLVRRRR